MTILWCGGEDIDFTTLSATVTTLAANFRSSYARCAVAVTSNGASADTPSVGSRSTLWATWRGVHTVGVTPGRQVQFRAAGTAHWAILFTQAATNVATLSFQVWDGAAWQTKATSGSTPVGALRRYDIYLSIGASGACKIWDSGTLLVDYAGDTRGGASGAVTTVDSVRWTASSGQQISALSEVILTDEDTRLLSLATLAPSGAGDTNTWTGAYTDIDETTNSDADVMYTNATGQDSQIALSDLPTGTFTVRAVKIAARASTTAGATATAVALGVKSGGSIDAGSAQTLTTAWATYERLMAQNPVTANTWQTSEANALQLNFRSG